MPENEAARLQRLQEEISRGFRADEVRPFLEPYLSARIDLLLAQVKVAVEAGKWDKCVPLCAALSEVMCIREQMTQDVKKAVRAQEKLAVLGSAPSI